MWLSQQTRPDLAFAVSKAAQRSHCATIGDLQQLQKLAKHAHDTADKCLVLRRGAVDPWSCTVVGFGDAAWASKKFVAQVNDNLSDLSTIAELDDGASALLRP